MQLLRLWWDFSTVWIWKGKWKKSWEEISDIRCRELEELNWYSSSEKSEVTCRNFSLLVTTERPQASLVTIPGGFFNDINYFWWSTLNWELNINVYSDTWQRRFVSIRLLHNSTSNWAAVSLSKVATVVTELSLSLNSHLVKIVRAESVNERSFPDCSISQGDQSEGVGGDHLAPVHRHPHSLTSHQSHLDWGQSVALPLVWFRLRWHSVFSSPLIGGGSRHVTSDTASRGEERCRFEELNNFLHYKMNTDKGQQWVRAWLTNCMAWLVNLLCDYKTHFYRWAVSELCLIEISDLLNNCFSFTKYLVFSVLYFMESWHTNIASRWRKPLQQIILDYLKYFMSSYNGQMVKSYLCWSWIL